MPSPAAAAIAEEGDHLPELCAGVIRPQSYAPELCRVLRLGEQPEHSVAALNGYPVGLLHFLHY